MSYQGHTCEQPTLPLPLATLIQGSKWFLKALGPQNLYKMLEGFEDKSIQAVATFAYSEGPGHEPILFQGRTDVCQSRLWAVSRIADHLPG